MERAKRAESSLFKIGWKGSLTILQQLKEAGGYVEFNKLIEAGNYSNPSRYYIGFVNIKEMVLSRKRSRKVREFIIR